VAHRNDDVIKQYETDRDAASATEDQKKAAQEQINYYRSRTSADVNTCYEKEAKERDKASTKEADKKACQKKIDDDKKKGLRAAYQWKDEDSECVNLAEHMQGAPPTAYDECSNAAMMEGTLKGQNCKKALNAVHDVSARNSALSDATTAATTVYSNMQATGATGAQNDAQTRQANIMKTLALSKLATGALNLQGAMELKSAASGATSANSTITEAQKGLAAKCSGPDVEDQQVCFYQNAQSFGISADQSSYLSFERMRSGAQQSQDQADAANALAKSSMLTGAADMLVGLQAYKMAQMANKNAQQMAPPPIVAPPGSTINFGSTVQSNGDPVLGQAATPPTDYGNPSDNPFSFGAQKKGRVQGSIAGSVAAGKGNGFQSARSGVSGGGGGASAGGGSLRPGGGGAGAKNKNAGRRITTSGEYNMAGGGAGSKGGGGGEKVDAANPFADALAKLFPTDPTSGKPVVDARQIASAGGEPVQEMEQDDQAVTASDLTIFEQITAKYRQLDGTGRF
jgi:hypothetical protein